jgi:hypothetical protein
MVTAHGIPAPDACSVGFDTHEISAYGTAARAQFFVALEQPGPWGRDAAAQSHLAPDLGRELSTRCAQRGGRLTLLRRPGRHADEHGAHMGGTTVMAYLAWAGADPWLLQVRLEDPAALLELDLEALARGDRSAVLASVPAAVAAAPVLLVCTNGRRDVCCAVRGRPVALDAATLAPGRIWEASHTGGHRFAPTGVLLPHGMTFARLDAALCHAVVTAAAQDRVPVAATGPLHDRGRSALEPGAQTAEAHVRHLVEETGLNAFSTTPGSHPQTYAVRHRDGRSWEVRAHTVAQGDLPESCGKSAVSALAWSAVAKPVTSG